MKLDVMDVEGWPVWSKEVSTFEWSYDSTEICYILEGEAIVTPQEGEPVTIRAYGNARGFPIITVMTKGTHSARLDT